MHILPAKTIESISMELFEAAGVSKEESMLVTRHMIEASLAGVDSHGVVRIPEYIGRILRIPEFADMYTQTGVPDPVRPNAKMTVERETTTTAILDGGWGFGQVAARKAMNIAIEKAKSSNVGIVAVRNVDQIMRAADYTLMATQHGMIGALFVKTIPVMAPTGGRTRILGNNPISFAIPAGEENPIVVDFAMSVVAGGKVVVAAEEGEPIPTGWLIDSNGNETTNPNDFMSGGSLLPAAKHKGYGLSVVMEVLGGILSGAGALSDYAGDNAFLAMAINVEAFMPLPEFKKKIDKLIRDLRNSPRVQGIQSVVVPGEPEFRMRDLRIKQGIPIPNKAWANIQLLAKKLNVKIPDKTDQ